MVWQGLDLLEYICKAGLLLYLLQKQLAFRIRELLQGDICWSVCKITSVNKIKHGMGIKSCTVSFLLNHFVPVADLDSGLKRFPLGPNPSAKSRIKFDPN